jgi:hypothetical protein
MTLVLHLEEDKVKDSLFHTRKTILVKDSNVRQGIRLMSTIPAIWEV